MSREGTTDSGSGTLDGFAGTITSAAAATTPASRTMTAAFKHPALANRGYRCVRAGWDDTTDGAAGWFDGFAPMTVGAEAARAQADAELRVRFGARYTRARSRYLACPREELIPASNPLVADPDTGEFPELQSASAICMYFLRTRDHVRTGSLTVTANDETRSLSVQVFPSSYTRRWRTCKTSVLGGRLRANVPCGSIALVSGDVHSSAAGRFPRAPARRSSVYRHGTNTAGFTPLVRYRCTTRSQMRRGVDGPFRRSTASCSNALGERFTLTFDMA